MKGLNIFLSYGHDIEEFAKKIRDDLVASGHNVWMDQEMIKIGDNWQQKIEDGIKEVCFDEKKGRFLLLMTPHIFREEKGNFSVTLSEITAVTGKVQIFPVMVKEAEPPFLLNIYQYLDFRSCFPFEKNENEYKRRFTILQEALESNSKMNFDYFLDRWLVELSDTDNEDKIKKHKNFIGRQWLLNDIKNWLSKGNEPIYCIEGDAGSGKSAFSAYLSKNSIGIDAYQFISFSTYISPSPFEQPNLRKAFFNIIYQLSKNIPGYWNLIKEKHVNDLKNEKYKEDETDAFFLLKKFILNLLMNLEIEKNKKVIILIDAIDELFKYERDELISNLLYYQEEFPDGLRFIITTRPPNKKIHLNNSCFYIKKIEKYSEENKKDLKDFIITEFKQFNRGNDLDPEVVDIIFKKSEGIFLYLNWLLKEYIHDAIYSKEINIEHAKHLPQGLNEVIERFFKREYKDITVYNNIISKIIAISFAAQRHMSIEEIFELLDEPKQNVADCKQMLGTLFTCEGSKIIPFHKSVYEWVTDKEKAGEYYVDVKVGHEVMAAKGEEVRKKIHNKYISESLNLNNLEERLLDELAYHYLSLNNFDKIKEVITEIGICVRFFENDLSKLQLFTFISEIPEKEGLIKTYLQGFKQFRKLNSNEEIARAYHVIGLIFFNFSIYKEAECFYKGAVSFYKKNKNLKKIAHLYNDLGEIYNNEASKLSDYFDDIDTENQAIKNSKLKYLKGLIHLVVLGLKVFRYILKAKRYYIRSIKLREKELGHEHQETAESINNLGHAFLSLDSLKKSEKQYKTAFEIRKKILPLSHRDVAEGYYNIGMIQTFMHTKDSQNFLIGVAGIEEAIKINESALNDDGQERHDQSLYHYMAGLKYIDLNNFNKAIDHFEKAVIHNIRFYGVKSKKLKEAFKKYEDTFLEMKKNMIKRESLNFDSRLLKESIDKRLGMVPENSPEIISIHIIFATVFLNNERIRDAEIHLKAAGAGVNKLRAEKELSESEKDAIIEFFLKTSRIFINLSQYEKVKEQTIIAFGICETRKHGLIDQSTIDTYIYLVMIYLSIDVVKRGEAKCLIDFMIDKSNQIESKFIEKNRLPKMDLYHYLAVPYNEIAFHIFVPQKNWAKAEDNYKKAIELVKKSKNHVEIANMELNLQTVYYRSGQKTDKEIVKKYTGILEAVNDSRAMKGQVILSGPKVDYQSVILKLSFSVAASDGKILESELNIIKKILQIEQFEELHNLYESLKSRWQKEHKNHQLYVDSLIKEAIKETINLKLSENEIKNIIGQAIIVSATDLHVIKEELDTIYQFANHFGFDKNNISEIVNKLNL